MNFNGAHCAEDQHKAAVKAFEATVVAELKTRIDAKRAAFDAVPRERVAPAHHGVEALFANERSRLKAASAGVAWDAPRTLSLTARNALSVSVPPYDVQWTSGPFDDANKNGGTFVARSIDSLGYQAAGVGLFVNTPVEADVRFSADAAFHSRWTDLVVEGAATTEGGVGVLVYEGGNVIARRDALLWNDFQSGHSLHGNSGDDVTYLTQTAAGQTYFHMLPGRQYLVWIWAWTTAAILGNDLAIGTIEANVPFVVLERE